MANQNTGFKEIWTALPLKYLYVSLHNFGPYHQTIPTQTKTRSKLTSNPTQTNKNKNKERVRIFFLTLISWKLQPSFPFLPFLLFFLSFLFFSLLEQVEPKQNGEKANQRLVPLSIVCPRPSKPKMATFSIP